MVRISAIEVEPRHLTIGAHRKIAATAVLAREAMAAVPAYANSLALPPIRDAGTEPIDASGDFVTRHTWISKPGPETVFHEHIAVANAADLHLHPDLRGAWFREGAFDQFPITARSADLCGFHFGVHKRLLRQRESSPRSRFLACYRTVVTRFRFTVLIFLFVTVSIVLFYPTTAGAHTSPDLTGHWRLNPALSQLPPELGFDADFQQPAGTQRE